MAMPPTAATAETAPRPPPSLGDSCPDSKASLCSPGGRLGPEGRHPSIAAWSEDSNVPCKPPLQAPAKLDKDLEASAGEPPASLARCMLAILAFSLGFGLFGAAVERLLDTRAALVPLSLASMLSCTSMTAAFALGFWGARTLGPVHAAGLVALLLTEAAWGLWDNLCRRQLGATVSNMSLMVMYGYGLVSLVWAVAWAARKLGSWRTTIFFFAFPICALIVFFLINDMTIAKWYAETQNKWIRFVLRGCVGGFFWLLVIIAKNTNKCLRTPEGATPLPFFFAGAHLLMTFWSVALTFGIENWTIVAFVSVASGALNVATHELWWQSGRAAPCVPARFRRYAVPRYDDAYAAQCVFYEAVSRLSTVFAAVSLYGVAQYVNHRKGVADTTPGGRVRWTAGVFCLLLALELAQLCVVVPRSHAYGVPSARATLELFRGPRAAVLRRVFVIAFLWWTILVFAASRVPWSFIVSVDSVVGDGSSSDM
eukprot:m51a1_g11246 hypothetical protein (483) ;mRNA; f:28365-30086